MKPNISSTLAALAVGRVVSAEHYRDDSDVTWLRLQYADARELWLSANGDGKRLVFSRGLPDRNFR